MKFNYFRILLLLILFSVSNLYSQELKFSLQLNHQKIPSTNNERFVSLEKEINNFMKNRKWTSLSFKEHERINFNFVLNLTSQKTGNIYSATLQVSSTRPIYNSIYNSQILSFLDDKIEFKYIQGDYFEFNENAFTSDLSSVCAYYVYLILGLDFDSFSMMGGNEFYIKAENIVSNAQSTGRSGWTSGGRTNMSKYKILADILNVKNNAFRKCLYSYHRKGLDFMYKNSKLGRENMLKSLELLKPLVKNNTGLLQAFFDAKIDEIVNVFSEADINEKDQLVKLMRKLSPSRIEIIKKIYNE